MKYIYGPDNLITYNKLCKHVANRLLILIKYTVFNRVNTLYA